MAIADKIEVGAVKPVSVPGAHSLAKLSFWFFALTVVLLPIGLGGNRPFPLGLAQAGLAISFFFLIFSASAPQGYTIPLRVVYALCLFCIVMLWAFIQTQPFVPLSWTHPIWQEAAHVLGHRLDARIAMVPEDALSGLLRLMTYIVCGLLAFCHAQDPQQARKLIKAMWISGIAICSYGLINEMLGTGHLLWFDKTDYLGDVTGTFINRNHFAIYAGLVFLCGFALLLQSWRKHVSPVRPTAKRAAIRQWFIEKGLLRVFFLALALLSIVLSHSRAGLVLTLVGLCSYCFFYGIYTKNKRGVFMVFLGAIAFLVLAFTLLSQFSERFAILFIDYSSQDRGKIYEMALHAIKDNPFFGYGLNGFQPVFRLYEQGMALEYNRVHSDVLESLLDLGVPAGLLLWAGIVLLVSGLWHGVTTRKRNGIFPTLGLTSAIMVFCHATVDFSLQIPGVVFYLATLMGTGLAHSWGKNEETH